MLTTRAFVCTILSDHVSPFWTKRLIQITPTAIMTYIKSIWISWSLMQVIDKLALFILISFRLKSWLIYRLGCFWASTFSLSITKLFFSMILSMQKYRFKTKRFPIKPSVGYVVIRRCVSHHVINWTFTFIRVDDCLLSFASIDLFSLLDWFCDHFLLNGLASFLLSLLSVDDIFIFKLRKWIMVNYSLWRFTVSRFILKDLLHWSKVLSHNCRSIILRCFSIFCCLWFYKLLSTCYFFECAWCTKLSSFLK